MRSPTGALGALLLAAILSCCAGPGKADEVTRPSGINAAYYENPDPDAWVARFEVESREIWSRRAEIVAAVGARPGCVLADVGAGTGFLTLDLSRQVYPTGKVIAVDIIPEFLERIEERAAGHAITNVETVLCTETSTGLRPESVDVVFCCDTYHHFTDPASTLASIHAALRDDGEFVVIDFIRDPFRSREWILGHVRAGEEVVFAEISAAGFDLVERRSFLTENYFLRFRKR